jgi:hypothetical protein
MVAWVISDTDRNVLLKILEQGAVPDAMVLMADQLRRHCVRVVERGSEDALQAKLNGRVFLEAVRPTDVEKLEQEIAAMRRRV